MACATIRGFTYVGARDITLGMDFLQTNSAIFNLQTSTVTVSTEGAITTNNSEAGKVRALRIVDKGAQVLPRSSTVVVKGDLSGSCKWLVDKKTLIAF